MQLYRQISASVTWHTLSPFAPTHYQILLATSHFHRVHHAHRLAGRLISSISSRTRRVIATSPIPLVDETPQQRSLARTRCAEDVAEEDVSSHFFLPAVLFSRAGYFQGCRCRFVQRGGRRSIAQTARGIGIRNTVHI